MVLHVALYALVTALATGLGAIPLLWLKKMDQSWVAKGSAVAAGAMLGASVLLIKEGSAVQTPGMISGLIAGGVFIALIHGALKRYKHLSITNLSNASAHKILMVLGIMTLHSFSEGVGIGVSFNEGLAFGLLITIALAIHNIPEGLAISLVMVPRGTSVWRAALWSIFSSLPQVITAVPAFLFVEQFKPFLAPGLGFAAGAMIWMCAVELLPESFKGSGTKNTIGFATGSALIMILLERLLP
jgi:zinc transporter ZupT